MPTLRRTGNVSTPTPKPVRFSRSLRKKIALVAAGAAALYRERGRDFPWRHETNPYQLAVAEILLQRTRAASALPVYETLVRRYPSASSLAIADRSALEETLRPIGLSRKRTLQLRAMAEEIERLGPTVFDDWRTLLSHIPGIGAYGARAIACFSRGERVGVVDANVARIFRRVFRVPSADPRAVLYQHLSDAVALEADDPRATNFGLLDIGAAVCIPKPLCRECPFNSYCSRYGV